MTFFDGVHVGTRLGERDVAEYSVATVVPAYARCSPVVPLALLDGPRRVISQR